MITREQALTAQEFHFGQCSRKRGPRGGVTEKIERWRRNGATKTWITRPDAFRVPVKHGLSTYGYITEHDAHDGHAAEDCPLLKEGR